MIVDLPVRWRGRALLHGMRTARDHLFRETVPVRVPEVARAEAVEVCRRKALWAAAGGQTISTLFHEGRFWRPVWRLSAKMLSEADLPGEFGQGELLGGWTNADTRYVADGPKAINELRPLPPDAPVRRWNGDDREARIAAASRYVASRCTLFDGMVYEESPMPVIMAVSSIKPGIRGFDLDAPIPNGAPQIAFCDDAHRIHYDFVGPYPRSDSADCFRLDRMEAAVEHAASRWNMDPDLVERIPGLEVLRPDLLAHDDEDVAVAAAAGEAYRRLSTAAFLLPRAGVEAVLDLRDARRLEPLEDRIVLVRRALSVLEEIDPEAIPPVLQTEVPKAAARLRAGVLRHEMFVAPAPDLLASASA